MFESLVAAADGTRGADAIGAWARVENAACARRLAATADVMEARWSEVDSADRDQWCIDNWYAVAAEIAAAQNVSLGSAAHQLSVAMDLRQRLPRVAEVLAAGNLSYQLVNTIAYRTELIKDPAAMAKVDHAIADAATGWGTLSATKVEKAIDNWVDRYDPDAVRRAESTARGRHVDIRADREGSGWSYVEAVLTATDGEAVDQRLDAMAHAVCEHDPRTHEQRRSDALGAFGHHVDRLACQCGRPDRDATARTPSAVIVNVVAEEKSLGDDTAVVFDGPPKPYTPDPQALVGPAITSPAVIMGGALIPAPLLAAKLAGTATIRLVHHPGEAAPEPRYTPSAGLARFVRCRDLTCRFPGCDEAADHCDLDHTIPYPGGPTQASNLKCLCRKRHLLKTFWGWRDQQQPDGTVIWTSPHGPTYTTYPGSRLLFPSLCRPTAPVHVTGAVPTPDPSRGLKMPRRKTTRAQHRIKYIEAERARNRELRQIAETPEISENSCDDAHFPSRPPPRDDDDPPF